MTTAHTFGRMRAAYHLASVVLGAFVAAALLGLPARADDGPATATPVTAAMQCERASEPGRVRCSVEARAAGGRTIAWADVAIVELPEFTAALKGRIGPTDATARDPVSQKWAFALIARKTGKGDARARVRLVVCDATTSDAAAPRCAPATVDVRATVQVG